MKKESRMQKGFEEPYRISFVLCKTQGTVNDNIFYVVADKEKKNVMVTPSKRINLPILRNALNELGHNEEYLKKVK